jgi:hypothetical protein
MRERPPPLGPQSLDANSFGRHRHGGHPVVGPERGQLDRAGRQPHVDAPRPQMQRTRHKSNHLSVGDRFNLEPGPWHTVGQADGRCRTVEGHVQVRRDTTVPMSQERPRGFRRTPALLRRCLVAV